MSSTTPRSDTAPLPQPGNERDPGRRDVADVLLEMLVQRERADVADRLTLRMFVNQLIETVELVRPSPETAIDSEMIADAVCGAFIVDATFDEVQEVIADAVKLQIG